MNKCQAEQTWYYFYKGHLQCADKKSEVRFMVSLRSWSIDGLDVGAQLPKVVKVNQLAHIHPLAREACVQQRAAECKTNTCHSPGCLLFRGHLHETIWQPVSTHKTNPVSGTFWQNLEGNKGKVSDVMASPLCTKTTFWNHKGSWRMRLSSLNRFLGEVSFFRH